MTPIRPHLPIPRQIARTLPAAMAIAGLAVIRGTPIRPALFSCSITALTGLTGYTLADATKAYVIDPKAINKAIDEAITALIMQTKDAPIDEAGYKAIDKAKKKEIIYKTCIISASIITAHLLISPIVRPDPISLLLYATITPCVVIRSDKPSERKIYKLSKPIQSLTKKIEALTSEIQALKSEIQALTSAETQALKQELYRLAIQIQALTEQMNTPETVKALKIEGVVDKPETVKALKIEGVVDKNSIEINAPKNGTQLKEDSDYIKNLGFKIKSLGNNIATMFQPDKEKKINLVLLYGLGSQISDLGYYIQAAR